MLKKIKFLSIFIFILGVAAFFILSIGINIDRFSFAGINVSKLYIKLDKKLIVQIEKIRLPQQSQTTSSRNDLRRHIGYLPTALRLFQKVDIERLIVDNNEFTITLDNDIFYVDTKFINIAAQPFIKDKMIVLKLYSMYLKDYDMMLEGEFDVNLKTDNFIFKGNAYLEGLDAVIDAKSDEDFIYFDLSSLKPFKNLHFVKNFVRLQHTIEEWMYDNITGDLNVTYLKGKINRETFLPVIESLDGEAYIQNANITFKHDLEPVKSPQVNVTFKNDNLSFFLEKPLFKTTSIDGSNVVIHGISKKGSNIVVNIKTKSRLNEEILGLLEGYKVKLPLIQTDGSTDSDFALQIYFNNVDNILTKGHFKANNSHFKLQNFEFFAHEADVYLDNSKVIIKDSLVEVEDLTKGVLNLEIDTKASNAKGAFNAQDLHIQHNAMDLIKLENTTTNVDVDFHKDTLITLDNFDTVIAVQNEGVKVALNSLQTLYPYSTLLQDIKIKQGELYLLLKQKDDININAKLKELDFPIAVHNQEKLKEITLEGSVKKGILSLKSSKDEFKLLLNKNRLDLSLKGLDLINEAKDEQKSETPDIKETLITTIKGSDSDIYITPSQKLLGSSYTLTLNKKQTKLDLQHNKTTLSYNEKNDNNVQINIKDASDAFINALLDKEELLSEGTVDLQAQGTTTKLLGHVSLDNTKIKNLALLNNLIIFVNTAPGLINPLLALPSVVGMATNSGFNLNGYRVVKGGFDFDYNIKQKQFSFTHLITEGNMADFVGQGSMDLNANTVDADIDIIFMKDYAKIVGYIPVINYLFLGDDNRVATSVQINGSLDDPKVNTNLSKEAANVPLDMVKRLFELPSKSIDYFKGSPKE